jgi:hypothetical protein
MGEDGTLIADGAVKFVAEEDRATALQVTQECIKEIGTTYDLWPDFTLHLEIPSLGYFIHQFRNLKNMISQYCFQDIMFRFVINFRKRWANLGE